MTKKRKSGSRDVKPTFRIYTEGQETEINYVKGYIDDYLKVKGYYGYSIFARKPKNHSPYGLLSTAKDELVSGDTVWLVFDRDGHDKIPETFQEAKDVGINIAFSSICFETWILMHYNKYTTKQYASYEDLKSDKLQEYIPDYEKAVDSLFSIVAEEDGKGLRRAKANAEKLCLEMIKNYPGRQIYELNPYTNVHELLNSIDEFIKKS